MAEKQKFTFTNSVGETFPLYPMNPLEARIIAEQIRLEFEEAGKPLEPPYYEATLPTGEKQKIAMRSLADAGEDQSLQAAWTAHELAKLEFNEVTASRSLSSYFLCVNADPDQYPDWKRRMKIQHIPIPDDEGDKFLLFVQTWVLRSKDDIPSLIFACTKTMVKISEEKQAAAEEMFRSQVEKAAEDIELTQ